MLANLVAYLFATKLGGDGYKEAVDRAIEQTLVVLLGVAIAAVGVALILSGTKTGQLASTAVSAVTTKGKTLVK